MSGEPPSVTAQPPNPEPQRRPPTPSAEPEHQTLTTRPSPHTVVAPFPIPASTPHAITHVTYVHHSGHVLLASRLANVHLLLTAEHGSPQTFFSLDSHLARYSSSCTQYYFIYIDTLDSHLTRSHALPQFLRLSLQQKKVFKGLTGQDYTLQSFLG